MDFKAKAYDILCRMRVRFAAIACYCDKTRKFEPDILYADTTAFFLSVLLGTSSMMDVLNLVKIATVCAAESEGLLGSPGRSRAYSVHPYNRRRDPFPRFYASIRNHQDKFFTYYRMSVPSFDHLLEDLRPALTKRETSFGKPICAEKRLTITIR